MSLSDVNIGGLAIELVAKLEEKSVAAVYLRNHEGLPEDVGNDVDLLIQAGSTVSALEILKELILNSPWRIFNIVEFGPVSIFLHHRTEPKFLHIDLFERLDWHCVPLADSPGIISRRVWNGVVHRPQEEDEIYLNVMTRLAYQGTIREKHRVQAQTFFSNNLAHDFPSVFASHCKTDADGKWIASIEQFEWKKLENEAPAIRKNLLKNAVIRQPASLLSGTWKYFKRSIKRAIRPPGLFVVFEGPDGVGKSTLIDLMTPIFDGLSGRKDTMLFHWKPTRNSIRTAGQATGASQDPRGRNARSSIQSLIFLSYHWLGFWTGYFRYVYPARIKNRAVIGDRYSYEFLLDPRRLRLSLPNWLLKFAAHTTPRPQLVLALTADAQTVHRRKPELSLDEINSYQNRLLSMADGHACFAKIDSSGNPEEIASTIYAEITIRLGNGGGK